MPPQYGAAEETSKVPIIRVETGAHNAPIFWTALFPDEERIATVSLDKTLRIWRTRDLRPIRTFRVPMEIEREGKLHFVAVSPNGKLVAVGGWTCWDWDKKGCVYLFDVDQGRLIKRIGGLPNIIGNIRFSPDGRTLAIGMHGNAGVAFVDLDTFTLQGNDREYAERVTGFDYSPEGYLVTGAWDGYLRVYYPDRQPGAREKLKQTRRIGAVFFSPDRRKLVVGAYDTPKISVVSLPKFNVLAEFSAADIPGQQSLRFPVWSRSGKFIYAIGDSADTTRGLIFKWHSDNPLSREIIEIPTHRVQSIHPMADDGLLFSTEDSSLGILDKQGKIVRMTEPSVTVFPQQSSEFRVSEDGSAVLFLSGQASNRLRYFNLSELSREPYNPNPTKLIQASPALVESKSMRLSNWKNSAAPMLNGKRLALDKFEEARSFAFSPTDNTLVLGTEWSLRCYGSKGKLLWRTAIPGVIWNVAVTGNGHYAVASLSDGTIRWYRMTDGKEIVALFTHLNGTDWVLWQPDGYYASSAFGDNYIGWHVNRGKDQEPDFYQAVQFERLFYRPDILKNVITSQPQKSGPELLKSESSSNTAQSVHNNGQGIPAEEHFSIQQISQIAPPRIRVLAKQVKTDESQVQRVTVTLQAEMNSLPMKDLSIYINSIPVIGGQQRDIKPQEQRYFTKTFSLPVQAGDNMLRVEVNNGSSIGLLEQLLEIPGSTDQAMESKGDLYIVAVGVNQFDNANERMPNLHFAVNDAVELAQLFEQDSGNTFENTYVSILSDDSDLKPTRKNILDAIKVFEKAGANDTVVLFLDSHGFSDPRGNYFFVPSNGDQTEIHDILWKHNLTGSASSLLGWNDFFDALRKAAGRRVLIIDTCHAGSSIESPFDAYSLSKRSAASLFPLLLASKGEEKSMEYGVSSHGLFTHAILEGLKGSADINQDRSITVRELYDFIYPLIKRLRDPDKEQTPQLISSENLNRIRLINTGQ
ncbi:hypothetical protein [Methyloglobulus sp.]|uniref:hypothetical protein n=1 Tax=Methyloglobulus sp. TaxID=2518622 RepID=UPI003988C0AF